MTAVPDEYRTEAATTLRALPERVAQLFAPAVVGQSTHLAETAFLAADQTRLALVEDVLSRATAACDLTAGLVRSAAELLIDPDTYLAASVVARSAVESAGLTVWLMSLQIPVDERIGRHFGRAREETTRDIQFNKDAQAAAPHLAGQLRPILDRLERNLESIDALLARTAIQPIRGGPTAMGSLIIGSTEYDVLAGVAHNRLASVAELSRMRVQDELALFVFLVSALGRAAYRSADAIGRYLGVPDNSVADLQEWIADGLGLRPEVLASTD